MREDTPRRTRRDPEEYYDVVYDTMPDRQHISRIIDHPRKLITVNLCADPWTAEVEETFTERTCYSDELED